MWIDKQKTINLQLEMPVRLSTYRKGNAIPPLPGNPPIIRQERAQAKTPTPAELAKKAKEKAEKAAEQPETVIGVDVQ